MRMFLLLTSLILVGCQTISDLPEEQRQVQVVHEVNGLTKSAIYVRAIEWFATTFRDSKSVLEVKDPDSGLLLGKGILPGGGKTVIGTSMAAGMTIKLEIKDGKYRTTYDGFTVGTTGTERQPEPGYEHDAVKKSARELDADMAAFIAKKPKDF